MRHLRPIYYICALTVLAAALTACGGADYMPNYFPKAEAESSGAINAPATPLPGGSCTIKFDATLCVVLKRGTMSYGGEGQEKICADDIPPIPIEVQGVKATLKGGDFPDIVVSGHGLPVPITINGKGKTDGKDNVATGAVDSGGNITLENFAFYISAMAAVGKIPNVTLTTGTAEGSEDLPDIKGSPATGNTMTLVGSTVMKNSVIPAADKYLLGTTLQIAFTGKITPKLSECGGVGSTLPTTVQVTKITTDAERRQHEQLIPNGTQMEVASTILIPEMDTDAGPQFEGSSKFRIRNISKQVLKLQIPPIVGPFHIRPVSGDISGSLPSQQSIVVQVTFRPIKNSTPGTVTESLSLGSDYFTLVGVQRAQSGFPEIRSMNESGTISTAATNALVFSEVSVASATQQAYFKCDTTTCNGAAAIMRCQPCLDVTAQKCQLLSIDQDQLPIGEVDATCKVLRPGAKPFQGVNMAGGTMGNRSQTIVIRNTGTKDLVITSVGIQEIAKSHSTNQFQVNPTAVYVGKDATAIAHTAPQKLPVTLPPYSNIAAYIIVSYTPTDLLGATDEVAGSTAIDQAQLLIRTQSASQQSSTRIQLRGTTTVQDAPPLEILFKTANGYKSRGNESDFPIMGITATTKNAAVSVHAALSGVAEKSMRITNVELSGGDADHFAWLDSLEKINAIPEPERCTVSSTPAVLHPNGMDLIPHGSNKENPPLLGCINFHRDPNSGDKKRQFETVLTITAVELDAKKQPAKRADGSIAESKIKILITATVNPRMGHMVFRLTQTMSILTTDPPSMASVSSADEISELIKIGRAQESDRFVFLGAMVLDPFDTDPILREDGTLETAPNDGITGIFRAIDTRPSTFTGSDTLFPYTSLIHDSTAPVGKQGMFFDYPKDKVPENFQSSGLRIYTAALSWPGPLERDPEKIPYQISECQQIDPCSQGELLGQKKGPTDTSKRGVCAFFYASAGGWDDSPSMHYSSETSDGVRDNLCKERGQPQKLGNFKGKYSTNGQLVFESGALRFWGPTFVHNIANGLDRSPAALDEVFHITFTTDTLVPKEEGGKFDYIPEKNIDLSKNEHKVNLSAICKYNTKNKFIGDKAYSSWRYFESFLVQDKDGKIPAGCPEEWNSFPKENNFAYLRGRPVDPATGNFSVVAAAKFGSNEDLTFVFQGKSLFIVLNGWLCDPEGSEAEGEGSKCFDHAFGERDALSQISIMKEGK